MPETVRRRTVLGVIAAVPLAVAGCTARDERRSEAGERTLTLKESPFLSGKGLPPLEERLPKEPKVADDYPESWMRAEIGAYGGEVRTASISPGWDDEMFIANVQGILGSPGYLGETITPNVVKSCEVSSGQRSFTFVLREGMKWSDGQPVTIEDVKFAVDDVLFNTELTPTTPTWIHAQSKATNKVGKFDYIDDWTFSITFDEPYAGFPSRLTAGEWPSYTSLIKPRHYLEKFHKDYADPAELAREMKDANVTNWAALFTAKDVTHFDFATPAAIGFPSLAPWILVRSDKNVNRYERNPYYWKVDAQGRQLPYIDTWRSDLVTDLNIMQVNTLAGQYDFRRYTTQLKDFALYSDNAERGGFRPLLLEDQANPALIYLNLTYDDPTWSAVVQDLRVRQALDLALDKEELRDTVFYGHATISPYSSMSRDLDRANALLDQAGLRRDATGRRLGPDGKRFVIPFDVVQSNPFIVPFAELVKSMWEELGLTVTIKVIGGDLWGTRVANNELRATVQLDAAMWYGFSAFDGLWAPLWASWWRSGGKTGKEPPADVAAYFELLDSRWTVDNKTAAGELWNQLRKSVGENLWRFRIFDSAERVVLVSSRLRNITPKGNATGLNIAAELWFYSAQ